MRGMPREEEERTGSQACPHLVLVDLNGLDLLGRAEVCGRRTMRYTLLHPASLTTIFPPSRSSLTPKPHSPILPTRQHLGAPLPQCQAVDVVCVAPEGLLQGQGQC